MAFINLFGDTYDHIGRIHDIRILQNISKKTVDYAGYLGSA